MNKLVIPSILLATVMVAGMFAFMPVEQASTVHDLVSEQGTTVLTANNVALADNGPDVVCTITSTNDALLVNGWMYNGNGGASDPTFEVISMTVGGTILEFGSYPVEIATNNNESYRQFDLIGRILMGEMMDAIIIPAADDFVITFADNEVNGDAGVILDIVVLIEGSDDAGIDCV